MTKQEVHERFKAIVAKVDAALEAETETSSWYDSRPVIDGRVMPVKPEYGGNVRVQGNLDGRGRRQ